MLLICCGMPRAGSTLQYQIVTELVETNNKGISIGWIGKPTRSVVKTLENAAKRQDKFLVLKCHDYTHDIAHLIKKKQAKAFYIYRDIRDVLVSLGRKFYNSVEEAIVPSTISQQLATYYAWLSLSELLVSKYEDVVNQLDQEVLKIASHLNIDITLETAKQIADKFSLHRQRQRIEFFDYVKDGLSTKAKGDFYDPVSQLHNCHIYSGESTQWKSTLSVSQIQFVEESAFSWLVDRNYTLSTFLKHESMSASASFYNGQALFNEGSLQDDLLEYKQAILLDPSKSEYHYELGKIHQAMKNYFIASNSYRHAIALQPSSKLYKRSVSNVNLLIKVY